MENEVKIYQHLMKTRASKYIPRLYGHFGHRNTRAIIISDEGPAPLYHPDDLSNDIKTEFFNALIEIHKANVVLDDLELYNVLIGERGLFISEFSRASMNHKCPGISECPELLGVQEFFDIDGSEWLTKDSPKISGEQIVPSGD
ncbi:hypothetical protein CPB86DRAFT_785238 [Serendipita vermifera]|nr:hypothetical protein CPB86DRAFT_785238 [Serendipita vermifera]